MSAEPVAVRVAKAALAEVGHPGLAAQVETNKHDMPMLKINHHPHREVIVRAFLLGHKAAGHDARYTTWTLDGFPAVSCRDCMDRMEATAAAPTGGEG